MSVVSLHFDSIDVFRQYVHQTKHASVRTVFYRVTENVIRVFHLTPRSGSTQEDIENIVSVISSNPTLPCWFIVRTDFNDLSDSSWSVGYFQPIHLEISNEAILPFVTGFTRELFPCAVFYFYANLDTLEDDIWSHLFPLPTGENSAVAANTPGLPSIHEIEDIPKNLKFVPRHNVRLSHYCRNRKCCFVAIPSGTTGVLIYLFNPEMGDVTCRNCGQIPVSSVNQLGVERTVYAFMKPDIRQYLASIMPRGVQEFKLMGDVSTCSELEMYVQQEDETKPTSVNQSRRRSNDSVLSPPTFEKYNKGASKRNRPEGQSLFN
jgi:hypothetical protein